MCHQYVPFGVGDTVYAFPLAVVSAPVSAAEYTEDNAITTTVPGTVALRRRRVSPPAESPAAAPDVEQSPAITPRFEMWTVIESDIPQSPTLPCTRSPTGRRPSSFTPSACMLYEPFTEEFYATWCLSRKERNRIAHMTNGNTTTPPTGTKRTNAARRDAVITALEQVGVG